MLDSKRIMNILKQIFVLIRYEVSALGVRLINLC